MSDAEVSRRSEEEDELEEEEEEDFTNLPLYPDNDDDSGSEFELPSESENEEAKAKKAKSKSDSRQPSHTLLPTLEHRPAPKKSAMKKNSKTVPENRRSVSLEVTEDPMITARRLEYRKRKAPRPPSKQSEIDKRQTFDPDNQYRLLLNQQIQHAVSPPLDRRRWKLKRTQVGSSIWHSREKGKLYVAIERAGRYDYKAIAEYIGSKSQFEVREYIEVFEEAIRQRERSGRIGSWRVEEVDVPAAVEISEECCAILEETAHALTKWQDGKDRRREIKKLGSDAWLLSAENVSWIEKDSSHKAGDTAIKEVLPAAELLNLRNWLKLSKGVFMNPADRPEQNWQEIIEPGDEHGIYATAFSDFHTLAVNLTKRLMAATMFAAESRLRADDSSYAREKGRLPKVTHIDVANAAENMGLKLDSHDFWRTSARRNHLEMVDDEVDDRNGGVAPMSHDLVEKVLSKRKKRRSKRRMRVLANADRGNMSSGASAYDSASEGSHISLSSDDDEAHATQEIKRGALKMAPTTEHDRYITHYSRRSPSPATSLPQPGKALEEQSPEERYVAYVESVDHTENVRAEAALWQLLQQDNPFNPADMDVEVAEEAELPRVVLKQKDELQTDKWRERAEYWAPWEHLDSFATEEDFARRPKKEKKDTAKGAVRLKPKTKGVGKPGKRVQEEARVMAQNRCTVSRNASADLESPKERNPHSPQTEQESSMVAPFQNLSFDAAAANDSRLFSDQDSVLGTRRAEMEKHLHSSPITGSQAKRARRGKATAKASESQEERVRRYASPVFSNTQLDALMGTQEPLGSLPEMEMEMDVDESSDEEEDTEST